MMRHLKFRKGASQSGFTLIELMVVLALMGGIMVTIYAVLFGTLKTRSLTERRVMGSRIGPLILDQIEDDLHQTFVYNLNHGSVFMGEDERVAGHKADRFSLVSLSPSTSPLVMDDKQVFSAVNEIGYTVTQNSDNPDFLVIWRREDYYVDDEPLKGGHGTPLYRRITQFNVQYYEQLGPDAEPVDDWSSEERDDLPAAMEIELSLEVEPRPVGISLSGDELDRRTFTFKRWVTFPQDMEYALAVRPAIPVPADESEEGSLIGADGGAGSGQGGSHTSGGGGLFGGQGQGGSGGGSSGGGSGGFGVGGGKQGGGKGGSGGSSP